MFMNVSVTFVRPGPTRLLTCVACGPVDIDQFSLNGDLLY
jgi:hypothetical protein